MRVWMPGRPGRAMAAGVPVRQAECSPAIGGGSIRTACMCRRSAGSSALGVAGRGASASDVGAGRGASGIGRRACGAGRRACGVRRPAQILVNDGHLITNHDASGEGPFWWWQGPGRSADTLAIAVGTTHRRGIRRRLPDLRGSGARPGTCSSQLVIACPALARKLARGRPCPALARKLARGEPCPALARKLARGRPCPAATGMLPAAVRR